MAKTNFKRKAGADLIMIFVESTGIMGSVIYRNEAEDVIYVVPEKFELLKLHEGMLVHRISRAAVAGMILATLRPNRLYICGCVYEKKNFERSVTCMNQTCLRIVRCFPHLHFSKHHVPGHFSIYLFFFMQVEGLVQTLRIEHVA